MALIPRTWMMQCTVKRDQMDITCWESILDVYKRQVLELRFGLHDGKTRTLEEVGKHFDVTRERIRQIEGKALNKLKKSARFLVNG